MYTRPWRRRGLFFVVQLRIAYLHVWMMCTRTETTGRSNRDNATWADWQNRRPCAAAWALRNRHEGPWVWRAHREGRGAFPAHRPAPHPPTCTSVPRPCTCVQRTFKHPRESPGAPRLSAGGRFVGILIGRVRPASRPGARHNKLACAASRRRSRARGRMNAPSQMLSFFG